MENPACQGTKRDFLKISFLNFLCECLAFFCNVQKTVTVADQTAVFPQHFDADRVLACEYPIYLQIIAFRT